MTGSNDELHRFVTERAGDAYRTAVTYDADGWKPLHVREDLRTQSLKRSLPGAIERARETEALFREDDYPPLGEAKATTELHEDGVVIHFREGEKSGTIVSLDRDAARRLAGFVAECLSIIEQRDERSYGDRKSVV